jgi:protein-tyrosine kinase
MNMLGRLFKKKTKRSSRVAAIVQYYDETRLPPPPELVEVAEKEGWFSPSYEQSRPVTAEPIEPPLSSEPVRIPEKESRVSPSKQAPPVSEPVKAPEREPWVPPSDAPSRPVVPDAKLAPPIPEPVKVPEKEHWAPPSYTPSRPVALDSKQPPPPPELAKITEKEGWVSPSYTQSRPVALDPKQLMDNRCVGYLCGSHESESYKVLRTQILQKTGEQGGTTVMITSALPGEGKTLTSINLALTFAKEYNQTVMLVDSDLRQQRVHDYLGIESSKGLTDYLLNGTSLADLIVWPGVEKFTVISGGSTVMASSELLSSPRMRDLVKDLKSRYPDRYVFFDVAPVLVGADALAFAPQVDYIILVVRAGSTSIEDVKLALDLLPRKKVLGVVLNRADQIGRYHMYKKYKEDPGTGNQLDRVKDVIEKGDRLGFVRKFLGSGRDKK